MLKEKVLKAINQQINNEYFSAFLYLSMSAWFQGKGLPGFANWMFIQYQEELAHGNKFFKYVHERGSQVILKPIEQVDTDFENVISVFEKTLKHEHFITDSINKIQDIAITESDHATQSFLKWFVDEQVEEEARANELLDTLRLINGQGNGIFMLDRELRQRVFVDPTLTAVV
jgi:ferritin